MPDSEPAVGPTLLDYVDSLEEAHRLVHASEGKAVEAALVAAEKAVSAALAASEKAVNKAEISQNKVNETQNEFRGTLRDQASLFMPRTEVESLVREIRVAIAGLENVQNDLRSRLDVGPPSLATLQTRSDESAGRNAGGLDTRTLMFALIAGVGTIVGIVAFLMR